MCIRDRNNTEAERNIQISFPDRDLEELAIEINDYISLYFNNNYQFSKSISAVSYTHLDVYKRQSYKCS